MEAFPAGVKPELHTEEVFGNTFAYFEFDSPQGAQVITHTFTATVSEQRWGVDAGKVKAVADWPKAFDPYRRGERLILVDDEIDKLAKEIAGDKTGPADRLDAVTGWVQKTLTYDHTATSLSASTAHALKGKRGTARTTTACARPSAAPSACQPRVVYGLHLFPKNLPAHCKLEAYLVPYGW